MFELEACSVRHALTRSDRRWPDKAVFPGKALSRFLSDSGGTGLSKGFQQPVLVPLIYAQTVFLTRQREIHFGSTCFPRSPLARLNSRRPRVLNCVLSSQGRHDWSATSRLGQLIARNAPPILQMSLDEADIRVARILTAGSGISRSFGRRKKADTLRIRLPQVGPRRHKPPTQSDL